MQTRENISVSVIIPCRNEIRFVRRFMDSVLHQDTTNLDLEILVADGMSDDGTRKILRQYEDQCPELRVIDNPGKIVSTGLNAAIRQARGEFIVRLDAHTEYAPDYIRTCIEVLRETGADNAGGPALTRAEGYMAEAIAAAFHSRFVSGGARFHDERYEGEVDTVTYGCWRRITLVWLGLFDESIYRSQDYELNARLRSRGGRIWQTPRIVSWYRPRTSLSTLFRQYFQYGFWKVAAIRKHGKPASWRNLVPGTCLLAGLLLLLGGLAGAWARSERWESFFLILLASLAALYGLISIAAAGFAARRAGWKLFPALPFVFATHHLAYALGFLLALAYRPMTWEHPSYLRRILTAITR